MKLMIISLSNFYTMSWVIEIIDGWDLGLILPIIFQSMALMYVNKYRV